MNPIEGTLRRVDRYQQRHGWLGFPFAVVKKFGDDKGGNLTTLLAWNGFFALFPLLLILVTNAPFWLVNVIAGIVYALAGVHLVRPLLTRPFCVIVTDANLAELESILASLRIGAE